MDANTQRWLLFGGIGLVGYLIWRRLADSKQGGIAGVVGDALVGARPEERVLEVEAPQAPTGQYALVIQWLTPAENGTAERYAFRKSYPVRFELTNRGAQDARGVATVTVEEQGPGADHVLTAQSEPLIVPARGARIVELNMPTETLFTWADARAVVNFAGIDFAPHFFQIR